MQVVGIDEAQFFESELLPVCKELARRCVRVIVAGLDQDYRAEPFETMASIMVEAEYVTKSLAICVICGRDIRSSLTLSPSALSSRSGRSPDTATLKVGFPCST